MKRLFLAIIIVMTLTSVSLAAGRVCNPTAKDVDPVIADFMAAKQGIMSDLAKMDQPNEVKNALVAVYFMDIFEQHGFDYAATLDVFLEKNNSDPGYAPYAYKTGLLGIMQYAVLALQSQEGRRIAKKVGFASKKTIDRFGGTGE